MPCRDICKPHNHIKNSSKDAQNAQKIPDFNEKVDKVFIYHLGQHYPTFISQVAIFITHQAENVEFLLIKHFPII